MLISCPTEFLDTRLGGMDRAIELLADAGFDAYDATFCKMNDPAHFMNRDGWREEILRLKAVADRVGIVCNQSHAPFPSSVGDEEKDEEIFQKIVRSMEGAAMLGAKIIVVHPKQHLIHAEHAEELTDQTGHAVTHDPEDSIRFPKVDVPLGEMADRLPS